MPANDLVRVIELLLEQQRFLVNTIVPPIPSSPLAPTLGAESPLWVPEGEEDLVHLAQQDKISKEHLEDALAQLKFENSEIEIAD